MIPAQGGELRPGGGVGGGLAASALWALDLLSTSLSVSLLETWGLHCPKGKPQGTNQSLSHWIGWLCS